VFPDDEPLFITIKRAQKLSGLGRTLIAEAVANGEIPSTLVGHRRRLLDYPGFKNWLTARSGELQRKRGPKPAPAPAPEVLPVRATLDGLLHSLEEDHGVAWRETADFSGVQLVGGKGPLMDALRRRRIARR
jgi:hypothetical protein